MNYVDIRLMLVTGPKFCSVQALPTTPHPPPLLVARSDVDLTGDQKVAGLILAGYDSGIILSYRLIMNYFLWSFSPFN